MLELGPPNTLELEEVARWRRGCPEALRTSDLISGPEQVLWFKNVDRSRHRYWGIYGSVHSQLIAFGGLTYISWENRSAEISLIVDPEMRRKGCGRDAVVKIVNEGFNQMNLEVIYGEVYHCNKALPFWERVIEDHGAGHVRLPDRKYWNGLYYDSTYFSIRR